MPSSAVVAGSVAGVLALAALGVGLGVGLRDNDDSDSSRITADDSAQSGTNDDVGTRTFGGLGIPDIAPIAEAPSPIDSTFAFAPTSTRAFGPGFAPSDAAPELAPDEALGPDAALSPDALVPVEEAPGPAPEPEAPVPEPVPAPVSTPVPVPAPAPAATPEDAEEPEEEEEEEPAPAPDPEEIEQEAGAASSLQVLDTSGVAPGPDGKYAVCPGSWEKRDWPDQPCGVTVNSDGSVKLGEFFGGFDGFWAVNPADGHENCFNWAITMMFQQKICETVGSKPSCQAPASGSCVCFGEDKDNIPIEQDWAGNQGIIKFLKDMRDKANPVNYDFPEDKEEADGGGRQANIDKTIPVFENSITIASNC